MERYELEGARPVPSFIGDCPYPGSNGPPSSPTLSVSSTALPLRHFALAALLLLSGCAELVTAIEEAFPAYTGARVEAVTLLTLPTSKPDGSPWDRSGAADPYVVVTSERGDVLFRGERIRDARPEAYPLRWGVGPSRELDAAETVYVDVYDDDLTDDDHVARYRIALREVSSQPVPPETVPLLGPNGEPMAELTIRWIAADA